LVINEEAISPDRPLLVVEHVGKNFGGLRALDDVSFEVAEGEVLGLIGPNGSGKSTLFNVITGFLPASSGSVSFNGENITNLPAYEVAKRGICRTFQLVRPFAHLSSLDNVVAGCMFGKADIHSCKDADERAMEILEQMRLAGKAGEKARDLTVMERKRLEVARALAGDPQLLLLDEFMAGLNPPEVAQAVQLVNDLNDSGITIIIVEHIVKAITNTSQRVIVLNAGTKLAEGTPSEVVNNQRVVEAYLGKRHARG
jgi:branched-chain amino acid transport system ATP-binding protein